MQTIKLVLSELHPSQQTMKRNMARFNVWDCGRRFGKDILDKDIAIGMLLSGQRVGWFEPTYKYLSEMWRDIRSTVHPVTKDRSEQEKRVELITGGVLEMWSLEDPDSGRGRRYHGVIVNEAAKVKQLGYSWENVIRATLADYRGSAIFSSTPKGLNYFYNLWMVAGDNPDWARFRYTTYDNPHIDAAEIDAMRAVMPERVFRQEVEAEFIEDGSYFQRVDEACTIEQPDKPEDHKGHHIVAGLDWAMSQDWTVLTVGCRDCKRVVDWDRFNQIDYTVQRERVIDRVNRWQAKVLPERNSIGQPNIEILEQRGVALLAGPDGGRGFNTTATTKPELIQRLASGLEHDGFSAPREYADELRAYEVEITASGHSKFSAPEGRHDDRVMSLALCWWAMTSTGRVKIDFV